MFFLLFCVCVVFPPGGGGGGQKKGHTHKSVSFFGAGRFGVVQAGCFPCTFYKDQEMLHMAAEWGVKIGIPRSRNGGVPFGFPSSHHKKGYLYKPNMPQYISRSILPYIQRLLRTRRHRKLLMGCPWCCRTFRRREGIPNPRRFATLVGNQQFAFGLLSLKGGSLGYLPFKENGITGNVKLELIRRTLLVRSSSHPEGACHP